MLLFKKTVPLIDLLPGFHDIHSHLLPGVDDGSKSWDQTCDLLGQMAAMGWKSVYFTPHVMAGMYGGIPEEELRQRFAAVPPIHSVACSLAAEYFMDESYMAHLQHQPLTLPGNRILVEFGLQTPMCLAEMEWLQQTVDAGYRPVLAHPERYFVCQGTRGAQFIRQIIAMGCDLQLNLLSLVGAHGNAVRRLACQLLQQGNYTFVGSDVHHQYHIDHIKAARLPLSLAVPLQIVLVNNAKILTDKKNLHTTLLDKRLYL